MQEKEKLLHRNGESDIAFSMVVVLIMKPHTENNTLKALTMMVQSNWMHSQVTVNYKTANLDN